MRRTAGLTAFFLAVLTSAAAVAQSTADESLAKVQRIVVIFMENRSFDGMFGNFPGANGLASAGDAAVQIDANGHAYKMLPRPRDAETGLPDLRFPADLPNQPFEVNGYVPLDKRTGDLIHAHYQEQMQINGGAMNRFALVSNAAGLVMGHYDMRDTYLWKLAQEFTLGDAMFHSAFGGSFLNHAMFVCSCAFRWPNAPADKIAKLDAHGALIRGGQVTPDGYAIETSLSVYLHRPKDTDPSKLVPPQTMPHIGDRMDAAGVSWTWYAGGYADAMAGHAPPEFHYHHQPFQYFKDLAPGTAAQKTHLRDYKDLLVDIQNNTLPQVTFYKPNGGLDQHPGSADITSGDKHIEDLVTRLRNSPAWEGMLIIITYDENGGAWDHVAPPRRDRWGPGTRIPLIALGPMVRRGHIDHTPYDFGSILRTIEVRWGVAPVNEIDANAYPMLNVLQGAALDR